MKQLLKEVSYLSLNNKIVLEESNNPKYTTSVGTLKKIPISRFVRNTNGRVYSKRLWERVLRLYEVEGMPALADHPSDDNIEGSVKDTVGVWHNVKLDNDTLYGDLVLIGDLGRKIVEILNAGGKIGVSTVGYGIVNDDGTVEEESYELIRIGDIVLVPSQKTYFDKSNYEPPNTINDNNTMSNNMNNNVINTFQPLNESTNLKALDFVIRETKNRLKKENPFLLLESKFTLMSFLNDQNKDKIEPLLEEIDKKLDNGMLITNTISFNDYKKSLDTLLEQYRNQNIELRNKLIDILNEKSQLVKHLEDLNKEYLYLKNKINENNNENNNNEFNPFFAIQTLKEYFKQKALSDKDILNLFDIKKVYLEEDLNTITNEAKYLLDKYKVSLTKLKEKLSENKKIENKKIETNKIFLLEKPSALNKIIHNMKSKKITKPVLLSVSDDDLDLDSNNKFIRIIPENNSIFIELLEEISNDKPYKIIDKFCIDNMNERDYHKKISKFLGLELKESFDINPYNKNDKAYSSKDLEDNLYKFDDDNKGINETINHPLRNNKVIPTDGNEQSIMIDPSMQMVIKNKYRFSFVDPEDIKIKDAFTQTYGAILEDEKEKIKKYYKKSLIKNPKLKNFEKQILNSESLVEAIKKIKYFEEKLKDTIIKKRIVESDEHYWLNNRL